MNNGISYYKIERAFRSLIKFITFSMMMVVFVLAIAVLVFYLHRVEQEKITHITEKFDHYQQMLFDKRYKNYQLEKATMLSVQLQDNGTPLLPANIEQLTRIIQAMSFNYPITGIKITSDTSNKRPFNNTDFTQFRLQEHNLHVHFYSPSDQYALSFSDALMHQLPGYNRITALQLTKLDDINSKVLNIIQAGNMPQLVETKLSFMHRMVVPATYSLSDMQPSVQPPISLNAPHKEATLMLYESMMFSTSGIELLEKNLSLQTPIQP